MGIGVVLIQSCYNLVVGTIRRRGLSSLPHSEEVIRATCRALEQGKWVQGGGSVLEAHHVVGVLARQKDPESALAFFRTLAESGFAHTCQTYAKLLEILGNAKEFGLVDSFLREAENDSGIGTNSLMLTAVVRSYCKAGMPDAALSSFSRFPPSVVDLYAYEQTVQLLAKAGFPEHARGVLAEMLGVGFSPSPYTYHALIDSLGRSGNVASALEMLHRMKHAGEHPDVKMYNSILASVAKHGKTETLHRILLEMEETTSCSPDTSTYNILIQSFIQDRKIDAALHLFEHMQESGQKANSSTYASLIQGLGSEGKTEQARRLYLRSKDEEGCHPDELIYEALVTNLTKAGENEEAWKLIKEMRTIGHRPCYYPLVERLYKAGKVEELCSVLSETKSVNFPLDIETYNRIISRLGRRGKLDEAVKIYKLLKRCHNPNASTFNTLVRIFAQAKDLSKARHYLRAMRKAGFDYSIITYSTMIRSLGDCGRAKEAFNLFRKMKSHFDLDAVAYGTTMKAFFAAGDLDKAVSVFEDAEKEGFHKCPVIYTTLIKRMSRAGRLKNAAGLFGQFVAKGGEPDAVLYNNMITIFFKLGMSGQAYDLFCEMNKKGCTPTTRTRRRIEAFASSRKGLAKIADK